VTSYYHRHGIVVTDRFFSAGDYRYEIADLTELMQARGSLHPGAMVGMVIAVAEAALIGPFVAILTAPVAWVLGIAALLVPCGVGLVCARRWPPHFELLARYRGHPVTLFATRDEREFGQVARALRRAVEATTRVY
jgi:hypothetical protein